MKPADSGVRAAETTLMVLETVAFAREELGVTQIAAAVGLTKSAIFRHLQSLVERGYFIQNPATARYRLGPRAWLIGSLAPQMGDLGEAADAPLHDLRDRTGFSVVLSTPTPNGAFVISTLPGTSMVEIGVRRGSDLSLHASAQGKVVLAFGQHRPGRGLRLPLRAFTPHTITDPDTLVAELTHARTRGFAVAPDEVVLGINAVAAPVFDADKRLVAAIAVVGSVQFLPADPDPATIAHLLETAATISRNLGHRVAQRPGVAAPRETAAKAPRRPPVPAARR